MTGRGYADACPACGSSEVTPYAVILGAREQYGYQCQDCAVTWPVLTHPALPATAGKAAAEGNTAA